MEIETTKMSYTFEVKIGRTAIFFVGFVTICYHICSQFFSSIKMDFDPTNDHNYIKIREKLNQDQIKLWLPPFLNDNEVKNAGELKKLANTFSQQLSLPLETCLQSLEQLQTKSLDNLKERNNFRLTGQAALKIRVPNEKPGRLITVNIELSKIGLALREEISKIIDIPIERLKVIFKGKVLKDEDVLENQGIKHGLNMMALVLKENSDATIPNYKFNDKQLDLTKADIKLLSKTHYFQIADQTGKMLELPQEEKESLILAMTLHEKGRAALKKEDFNYALILLLEAEKQFCQCNSSLLKRVDNYGVLGLDIVWCYLNLQSVTQLPDAEKRLHLCEQSFQQSYGTNLERLTAIKGSIDNESALFMRLHLLQAIVFYHQNKIKEATELLNIAEKELMNLKIDDNQLSYLMELGYETTEARLALRSSKGDISRAVSIIESKRLQKKENEKIEAENSKLLLKKKALGKCINGEWIEPELHSALLSMGFSYEISRWALEQSNNNINDSISLINENPQLPACCSNSNENSRIAKHSLQKVISIGFKPKMAKLALIKHKGNVEKAVEELLASEGVITGVNHSHIGSDWKTDTGNRKGNNDKNDDIIPSASQLEKKCDEAYSRLKEGISTCEEDHLDLNLIPETAFLYKYKELLTKR